MLQVCDTLLERCSLIWTKISNGCSDGIWSYATAYELNHIHTNQTIHWAMCICCVLHKFIPVFNLIKPIPHLSTLCKFWLTDWLTDRCEWVADVCVCVRECAPVWLFTVHWTQRNKSQHVAGAGVNFPEQTLEHHHLFDSLNLTHPAILL